MRALESSPLVLVIATIVRNRNRLLTRFAINTWFHRGLTVADTNGESRVTASQLNPQELALMDHPDLVRPGAIVRKNSIVSAVAPYQSLGPETSDSVNTTIAFTALTLSAETNETRITPLVVIPRENEEGPLVAAGVEQKSVQHHVVVNIWTVLRIAVQGNIC